MAIESKTDEELIAAVQRRDPDALEGLYERHRVLVYSLALRMLGNPTDAEDVVQEAFVNVWRAAHTFQRGRSPGRSWLLSIVHHRAIDKLRGRRSRPQSFPLEAGLDMPDSTDVWRDVSASLTGESVRRALAGLPPEQRETIEMAYFQGFSQSQIAERMDVPLGTVKGRMRIGLHKLKALLEGSTAELGIE
jgi:RNA polymerase sigma-70 factor (ECF subfamily)